MTEGLFSKGNEVPPGPPNSLYAFRSLASQRERKAISARSADETAFVPLAKRGTKADAISGVQGELRSPWEAQVVIVGIGNSFRGDDGAGWAVIDELAGKLPAAVTLLKQGGDIAALLEIFDRYPVVYLVDACLGEGEVGSWRRMDVLREEIPTEQVHTSTHGFSISQVIAMGKVLQKMPSTLILYALYASHFQIDTSLSSPVAQAIPLVAQALLQEKDIRICMKKE